VTGRVPDVEDGRDFEGGRMMPRFFSMTGKEPSSHTLDVSCTRFGRAPNESSHWACSGHCNK
jgi:hypothetical protein